MISAIIPAYNEADRIAGTIQGIQQIPNVDEILVVDDGSTDCTSREAENAGATVVGTERNMGKGAALNRGASVAMGDVFLMLDADLGSCSSKSQALFEPVLSGEADMTIASFPVIPGKRGGIGAVVRLARWGILRATGASFSSPLSGQRALRRTVWERIGGFEEGFGVEVALTIDALNSGFKVIEVPLEMTHRVTGRDWKAVKHRARQFAAVARALWKRRGVRA